MKSLKVSNILIQQDGCVAVTLSKLFNDGADTVNLGDHVLLIQCGADVQACIAAVNTDLVSQGFPPINVDDVTAIQNHAQIAFTTDKVAAYKLAHT